jgi:hypothetical protein
MGQCIIMLKNEVMAPDERHDNGPQDLVTVSHNPTANLGHSVHNVDISKPLAHTTPYMPATAEIADSSGKSTLLQRDNGHRR